MPLDPSTAETDAVGVLIPRDLMDVMDEYAREQPGMSTPEAVRSALREWAINKGLIQVEPTDSIPLGDLNASNDI